jgi:hypothetical protein
VPGIQVAPTTCGADPVLSSDGTDSPQDLLFANTSAYYTLNAKAGHSYGIEVWDTVDQTANVSPAIQLLASDCTTPIPSTNVTNVDPDLSGGFSDRISWMQGSDATVYIQVMNPDQNNPYTYQIRVTDTTLFNPRWSTYSGFDTQWGFNNTTAVTITGTLTITNSDGTVLNTVPLSLPPGRMTLLSAKGKSIPVDHYGTATLAYVGPAGAIQADAYFINGNATVIVPSAFASKHAYH